MARQTVLLIPTNDYNWRGLRAVLTELPDIEIVGETMDARQAIEQTRKLAPGVILLSVESAKPGTVTLVRELRAANPASQIAVFADEVPDAEVLDIMAVLGVTSCVIWSELSPVSLLHFLMLLTDARVRVASESVAAAFLATHRRYQPPSTTQVRLSSKQQSVLALLVAGLSPKGIAAQLGVARTTVSTHIRRMKDQVGAETRDQLIAIAVLRGLVDGEEHPES